MYFDGPTHTDDYYNFLFKLSYPTPSTGTTKVRYLNPYSNFWG